MAMSRGSENNSKKLNKVQHEFGKVQKGSYRSLNCEKGFTIELVSHGNCTTIEVQIDSQSLEDAYTSQKYALEKYSLKIEV